MRCGLASIFPIGRATKCLAWGLHGRGKTTMPDSVDPLALYRAQADEMIAVAAKTPLPARYVSMPNFPTGKDRDWVITEANARLAALPS
jgi:hypothetical protein